MESTPPGRPGSPGAVVPLQPVSGDRVNQQREASVHDKINQFNSLAIQSKQLERKTADAALKRAMLGREEAESEMRRYRDEARALRKQLEEGKERERRVGERLEAVMENYGRAKETHAHTQALWEKEIRRARKEAFKSQSVIVKLQEELKSARAAVKSAEELLDLEKERSKAREQEAFAARYGLVGMQEQLEQALERLRTVEQERDAFKALARNEEDIARLAAEGRLPLPSGAAQEGEGEDEFASPKKRRVSSISLADVRSSAASEEEIEELTRLWQWEKQRAERALEHVEFLEAECRFRCCSCRAAGSNARQNVTSPNATRRKRPDLSKVMDAGDLIILSEEDCASPEERQMTKLPPSRSKTDLLRTEEQAKGPRRSTIFVPAEGVFRTVSQEEAEGLAAIPREEENDGKHGEEEASTEPPTPGDSETLNPPCYARTPSVEPPSFAVNAQQRTSLLSLLDAPHHQHGQTLAAPCVSAASNKSDVETTVAESDSGHAGNDMDGEEATPTRQPTVIAVTEPPIRSSVSQETQIVEAKESRLEKDDEEEEKEKEKEEEAKQTSDKEEVSDAEGQRLEEEHPFTRPHTAAAFYTTTTKVPLREETNDPTLATRLLALQRTPSHGSRPWTTTVATPGAPMMEPSFDATNPALTPTMTREQALAQIRERRGRARSAAQGAAVTPRRGDAAGVERRDLSAPTGKVGGGFGPVTPGLGGAVRQVRS